MLIKFVRVPKEFVTDKLHVGYALDFTVTPI